jgi:hypothetical protein
VTIGIALGRRFPEGTAWIALNLYVQAQRFAIEEAVFGPDGALSR